MKKFKERNIKILIQLRLRTFSIFAQTQGDVTDNLNACFNANDFSTPIDNERYFSLPEGDFTHAQVLNITASSKANLLHKVLIIVDSTLYSVLTFEINRYAYDIHYVYGCNVIMEQVDSETCLDCSN